jgi:hypothetical protein
MVFEELATKIKRWDTLKCVLKGDVVAMCFSWILHRFRQEPNTIRDKLH